MGRSTTGGKVGIGNATRSVVLRVVFVVTRPPTDVCRVSVVVRSMVGAGYDGEGDVGDDRGGGDESLPDGIKEGNSPSDFLLSSLISD
jgi:hypothetical protein